VGREDGMSCTTLTEVCPGNQSVNQSSSAKFPAIPSP
jgi:hypothetical protein